VGLFEVSKNRRFRLQNQRTICSGSVQNQNEKPPFRFPGFFKALKEPTVFMKEPVVFYTSYLFLQSFENCGYESSEHPDNRHGSVPVYNNRLTLKITPPKLGLQNDVVVLTLKWPRDDRFFGVTLEWAELSTFLHVT
jgi:hypothetical protein